MLAYFAMGGNIGPGGVVTISLLGRAGTTALSEWAADVDTATWGQFFLSVVSRTPLRVARS